MKIEQRIIDHLQELIEFESKIEKTREYNDTKIISKLDWNAGIRLNKHIAAYDCVNLELSNQWGVSCLQIIKKISDEKSDYYIKFNNLFSLFTTRESYAAVKTALGILKAIKADYENGYLFDMRSLIEAEVFDEFLEQAEELLKKNYYQAAAVIVGCVLEDGLRKLGQRKIPNFLTDKTIDPMNVELAKAGIYNALWQKKIMALADLRNKAAHGKWTEFTEKDVEDMIRDVRRFMEDYFS